MEREDVFCCVSEGLWHACIGCMFFWSFLLSRGKIGLWGGFLLELREPFVQWRHRSWGGDCMHVCESKAAGGDGLPVPLTTAAWVGNRNECAGGRTQDKSKDAEEIGV